MRIREAKAGDLDAVISIQKQTPEAAQWRQADYACLRNDPLGLILVVELDESTPSALVGFAVFHRVLDEAELRNMAVDPAHWRRGVGRELLAEGRRRLLELGVKRLFLEVRASNLAAQRLYSSTGFVVQSRRKDYYSDPREDGLVLSLELK
jgi:[ribosomal protein S18]-alanine N-acetyltransferase